MSESSNCPQCGAVLPPNAPAGLCPRCVMEMNMATQTDVGEPEVGPHGTKVVDPPRTPPSPEEIAHHFPQFEILHCLGRGGMGVVYKARQKSLDRWVAIKILAPEREHDPQFAGRFVREARTLAQLNHPNIVTVHDFGEVGGMFYLVMEFVDGVNLRQLLRERKLKPTEALAIVPSICEALQYAHGRGVIHRDIKPENLLLDTQGRIKIADFGIAKIFSENGGGHRERADAASPTPTGQGYETYATQGQIVGTPAYMAPEQSSAPEQVDHRADIYALGVVFYEMLTGELPAGRIDPPSRKVQLDVRIDEIVLQALDKDPQRRYQSAGQFKTMVETLSSEDQTKAAPKGADSVEEGEPPARAPTGPAAEFSFRGVPWQIWVVVGMLALEGLGNILTLFSNPNALLWVAAKVLFIVGLLRRWRPVYCVFVFLTAIHAAFFWSRAPVVTLLNLIMLALVIYKYRFYFSDPMSLRRAWSQRPPGILPVAIAVLVAALWGMIMGLHRTEVHWFILEMLVVPCLVLGMYKLIPRKFPSVGWVDRFAFDRRTLVVMGCLWVTATLSVLVLAG